MTTPPPIALASREPLVRVAGLSRHFGDHVAVADLSFDVGRGELFGLVGPDGAGKTTTLRMLAGVLRPSAGDAWIGYRQPSGGSPGTGWVWHDGSAAGHTGWHPPDQPDDQNGSENGQEDCADMEIGWSWDWNDDDCSGLQAYVCERPL